MGPAEPRRRLIVNADDFGASQAINQAVIQAHQRGILTTASLMVNGDAFDEAVVLARENPRLGIGLHLTLCFGRATLPHEKIPHLTDTRGNFSFSPVAVGFRYYFSRAARRELDWEIEAQLEKFSRTGLPLDHLNGHLHFHLHPVVFSIVAEKLAARKVGAVRLMRDPVRIDWPLGKGRQFYRASHALVFAWLAARAAPTLRKLEVAHTRYVFGLLEHGRVDENYIRRLLRVLPPGDSELYSHPSLDQFKHEYEALLSPRVRDAVQAEKIELIRYQDLWQNCC